MENLSLIIFSFCLQAAIGIMLFIAIGKTLNNEGVYKKAALAAAVLAVIGTLASLLHLGQPFMALNALRHISTSWLSREIWFSGVFTGCTVLAVFLLYYKPAVKSAITGLTVAAALIGLVDVAFMAATYSTTSVPAWQGAAAFLEFYAAAITIGGVVFLALSMNEAGALKKMITLTIPAVIIIQLASTVSHLISMSTSTSLAAQKSMLILSNMTPVILIQWVLLLVGAGLLLWLSKEDLSGKKAMRYSVALLVGGQIIAHYLFYAMMVGTQVGLY